MFHTFFWSLSFSLSLSHGETWIPMEDLLFFSWDWKRHKWDPVAKNNYW
jgi:hypothetical protein